MSVNSQVAHTCSMACTCLFRKDLAEAMCPLKNTCHVHTIETVFHEPKLQIGKKKQLFLLEVHLRMLDVIYETSECPSEALPCCSIEIVLHVSNRKYSYLIILWQSKIYPPLYQKKITVKNPFDNIMVFVFWLVLEEIAL